MTPEQQDNMRAQISEYAQSELIDLAISLQNTIDANVQKIRGLENSQEQMGRQIPALQARLEELEELEGAAVDSEELAAVRANNEALQAKNDELVELNQALQKKLVGL